MRKNIADRLQNGVLKAYSAAATDPETEHPFPVGVGFAASLGYPQSLLDSLPATSTGAFAGVSNLSVFADISAGDIVLDLGCGAGLDSLVAAGRVGSGGRVMGVDFSDTMLARAKRASISAGFDNIEFYQVDARNIPLKTASVDTVLVNGIFNLNPHREAIFKELARVVRPGGSLYAAELILKEPLPAEIQASEENWFS